MSEDLNSYPDRVADLYEGKTIFVTGGTGFMGKVLVEKMLRSCPGIKKLILLIRTKKDKRPEERIRTIMDDPVSFCIKLLKKCTMSRKIIL